MINYNELIEDYVVDVEFPDVSGIEQLEMLLTRSEIADVEYDLTNEQRERVYKADKRLLEQVSLFYQAIQNISSLRHWREQHNAKIRHWWWYLDVIAQLNMAFKLSVEPVQAMPSSLELEPMLA